MKDIIVEEIHSIREKIARSCNFDPRKISEKIREHEAIRKAATRKRPRKTKRRLKGAV